jgi:tape measure domain-containing protein
MSETNSGSGTDIVNLGLSVDATQPEEAAKALDKLAEATIRATARLDTFNKTGAKASEIAIKVETSTTRQLRAFMELAEQEKKAADAAKEMQKVQEALIEASSGFISKLKEQVATFGMSREELLRYKAAQLEVAEAAEPLIQQLERMRRAAEETIIQQKRDIEMREIGARALREEQQAARRAAEEAEKLSRAKQAQFGQEARARSNHIKDYTNWWQEQLRIQDQTQAKQKQNEIVFMAFKRRTMMENRREAIRLIEEQEREAAQIAERQAMQEISWARMSVKQRIQELERLRAYQADPRISQGTINSMFSGAAMADLSNLDKMKQDFDRANLSAERLRRTTQRAANAAMLLRRAIAGAVVYFGAREISHTIDNYIKFTAQLKIATTSQHEYNQALADTRRIARQAENDLQATGTFYARIKRSVEELGLAQSQVAMITETVSLALRAGGATAQESFSAMLQLSQAFGRGVLDGQEFNAVAEASPVVMKVLAQGIGIPVGALKELSKQQKITSDLMAAAFTNPKALEELRKQASEVRNISSAMAVLKNSLMEYIGMTGETTGATKALTDAIKWTADNLDVLIAGLTTIAAISLIAWASKIVAALGGITAALVAARIAAIGLLASLGPLGWVAAAVGVAGTAWLKMSNDAEKASKNATAAQEASTQDIIAGLRKQSDAIEERNRIAREGVKIADVEGPDEKRMKELRKEMELAERGEGKYASLTYEQRMGQLHELGRQYGTLYAAIKQVQDAMTEEDGHKRDRKAEEWAKNLATPVEKMRAELKALEEEIGKEHPMFEDFAKRIQDKYAKKETKNPRVDRELEAYKRLTSAIQTKIEENELELVLDEKATESQKIQIKLDQDLAAGRLKLKKGHKEIIDAYIDELEKTELLMRMRKEFLKEQEEEKKAKEKLAKEEADWLEKKFKKEADARQKTVESAEKEAAANERLADTWGMSKHEIELLEIARLEEQIQQRESIALCDAETEALKAVLAARRKNADALGRLEGYEEMDKASKSLEKFLESQDKMLNFGDSIAESFGRAGDALVNLLGVMEKYQEKQNVIDEQRKNAMLEKDQEKRAAALLKLQDVQIKNQINGYADMANAAKGLFNEQSNGYKMLDGVAKVAHAVQMAMTIKELALLAKKAVLTQASGDPYTAFARMAAMAAAVAAIGFAVGGGFNSGGVRKELHSEGMQERQGTGTVLGDLEAKSKSIANAIQMLAENSDETMPISQAMLKSLRAIELSMAGLSNLLFRSYGITGGNTLGFVGSNKSNGLDGLWGRRIQKLVDSGLFMNSGANLGQLSRGEGIGQFGTVQSTKSSFFGLRTSTKYSNIYGDIDEDMKRQLGMVFSGMIDGLASAGESLGFNADKLKTFMETIVWPDGGKLSLRGLKGQELTDELNAWFSTITDQVSGLAFGDHFKDFQKIGEGYGETIFRVANGIEKARVLLENLGITTIRWTELQNRQGEVDAELIRESILRHERFAGAITGVGKVMANVEGTADELIEAYEQLNTIQRTFRNVGFGQIGTAVLQGAGGADKLADALSTYNDIFFNDQEKAVMLQRNLVEDFRKIGINTVPKTREEFRKLVEVLSKNTSEASQKLLGRVLNLAEQFDDTATAIETAANEILSAWQNVSDGIIDEIKRIRGIIDEDSGGSFARAQSEFAIATAKARAGDQEAADLLPGLSRTLLELAEKEAASAVELNRIRAMTAGSLEATLRLLSEKYGVNIDGFASGGNHRGGFRIVGENGPELEATGPSRIFSSQQTRAILTGELKQELSLLRQEVVHLRKENFAAQAAIARNTEKMEKVLTRADTPSGLLITENP